MSDATVSFRFAPAPESSGAARPTGWRRAVAFAAVSLLALASCEKRAEVAAVATPEAPSSRTRWVNPAPAQGRAVLEAPARVLAGPDAAAAVSAPMRARVLRVLVRPGQQVEAGQPMLEVLMPEAVQAAGALQAASVRLEAFERRRAQLESLKAEGLVRAGELAEVEGQAAEARAAGQAARATLRAAGLMEKGQAPMGGDGVVSLRAPIDGIVVAVAARLGQVHEPGAEPLAEVARADDAQVEARLPAEAPSGAGAVFVSSAGVQTPLVQVSVSPRREAADGARLAWFRPETEGAPLSPGSAGRVRFTAGAGWLAVPARAVVKEGEATFVLRHAAGGAKRHAVRVILTSGAEAIVEGLDPKDEVAADAALGLQP